MTDIQQLCNELQCHLDMVKAELGDLDNGKKSAGPRARKSLQSVKAVSQKLRGDIIQKQKSIPTKTRVRKAPPVVDIEDMLVEEPPVLERQETVSVEEPVKKPTRKRVAKK